MDYLILETGCDTSSEAVFWREALDCPFNIVYMGGNEQFRAKLECVKRSGIIEGNKLSGSDRLFVCYDIINIIGSDFLQSERQLKLSNSVINLYRDLKNRYSCKIFVAKDFCFEAMCLRLKLIEQIADIVYGPDKLTMQELNCLQSLRNNDDITKFLKQLCIVSQQFGITKTPEGLLAMWLSERFCGAKNFKIQKGQLGLCWYKDCVVFEGFKYKKCNLKCPFYCTSGMSKCNILYKDYGLRKLEDLFMELI